MFALTDGFDVARRGVYRPKAGQAPNAEVTMRVDDLSRASIDRVMEAFIESMKGLVVGGGEVYFTFLRGDERLSLTRRMPLEEGQEKRLKEIAAEQEEAGKSFFDKFFGEK